MITKSLVIFMGFGVLAGLIFGLYLLDAKNTNQLIFTDDSSISVVTEKTDYKLGEKVKIRIVNSGTTPLNFSDNSYGLTIRGLSGVLIFSPSGNNVPTFLKPHEEIAFEWNQIKNDSGQVNDGLYKIISQGLDPTGKKIEKSTTIHIWK